MCLLLRSILVLSVAFIGIRCDITNIVSGLRQGEIRIDCSQLQVGNIQDGADSQQTDADSQQTDADDGQLSADEAGELESIYMGYASGSGNALVAVYRLPMHSQAAQVEILLKQTCMELLEISTDIQLILLTSWSRWGQCNPGTCQESRMRPCLWDDTEVQCPERGEQEVRVCQEKEQCLDSCVILKKPVLTKKSDIKLSWNQNSNCDITRASANVVVEGVSRVISAPKGMTKLVIPYNSRDETFSIQTDFRGTFDGISTNLKKDILLKNLQTFDWSEVKGVMYANKYDVVFTGNMVAKTAETVSCTKRETTDSVDFACRYDAKVTIRIAVDGFQYGDYNKKGTVEFTEQYCNEDRTVNVEATSRSGERILETFDLPAKTGFKCKTSDEDAISISNEAEVGEEVGGTAKNEEQEEQEGEESDIEEESDVEEEENIGTLSDESASDSETDSEDEEYKTEVDNDKSIQDTNDADNENTIEVDDKEDAGSADKDVTTNNFAKDHNITYPPRTSSPPRNVSESVEMVDEARVIDNTDNAAVCQSTVISVVLCLCVALYF